MSLTRTGAAVRIALPRCPCPVIGAGNSLRNISPAVALGEVKAAASSRAPYRGPLQNRAAAESIVVAWQRRQSLAHLFFRIGQRPSRRAKVKQFAIKSEYGRRPPPQ